VITQAKYFSGVLLLLLVMVGCEKSSNTTPGTPAGIEVNYEASTDIFPNPERGFIKTYPLYSGQEGFGVGDLATLRAANVSLILRIVYLDGFKDKPISAEQLTIIRADLAQVREAGLKCILRFAYTDAIDGTDAPLEVVLQHIDQLTPVFQENEDVIAFVQAGFIGAWGEWHSSSNGLATTESQREVVEKLITALPPAIMIQVRTPRYKQQIFNTTEAITLAQAYASSGAGRVGHHNDCFLSGGDNYGTYGNIALEKEYISKEALYVPTGGETCPPTGGYDPTCDESRNEMKLLKWTYLNLDWYPATISAWKASGCFNEFHTYLGYRLALTKATYPAMATVGSSIDLKLSITNKGYAPLYHAKSIFLSLKNKATGEYVDVPLQFDIRTVKPVATIDINESVSLAGVGAGRYDLFLKIADKATSLQDRTEYSVRLANKDAWIEENGGINNLNHELTIQ
jgi:hypothetical protein